MPIIKAKSTADYTAGNISVGGQFIPLVSKLENMQFDSINQGHMDTTTAEEVAQAEIQDGIDAVATAAGTSTGKSAALTAADISALDSAATGIKAVADATPATSNKTVAATVSAEKVAAGVKAVADVVPATTNKTVAATVSAEKIVVGINQVADAGEAELTGVAATVAADLIEIGVNGVAVAGNVTQSGDPSTVATAIYDDAWAAGFTDGAATANGAICDAINTAHSTTLQTDGSETPESIVLAITGLLA